MVRTAPDPGSHVAEVRRFNRFYTQHLGVLQDAWLDSPFSLTEARVLYEIKERQQATASDLVRDLGLDAGYLSRILRRHSKDGLIRREVSPKDGRRSFLMLTPAGRKAFAPLEERTIAQVGEALVRLSAGDRDRLVSAMATIERLIGPPAKQAPPILLRQPRPGDLGWVVQRHAQIYGAEYGWADNFEGVCAQIVADFARQNDPVCERCWIAEMDGGNVGSVFLVREAEGVARLRLLLVDPIARGHGLGARLTEECLAFARQSGYRRVVLWTHEVLTAARHIYARAGFRLLSSEAKHNFGQDVVSEHWELAL